ncbi:MAG: peptidoglycan DD-metalloendopeptidase family protein [Acidimicrobiales bacterium]
MMAAKLLAAGVSIIASPLVALLALVSLATANAATTPAPGQAQFDPSDDAVSDIPPLLLDLYIRHAARCAGLPWQIVAAIGKVESDHGRFGGATLGPDGTITPPIIGIALDGTNGTARTPDTDDGRYDADTVWDRAVGPFQFIPTSWAIFGQDGNRDGDRDPNNVHDAVPAAVAHLCPHGRLHDIEAAIFAYNRSSDYVDLVLEWAARYTGPLAAIGPVVAGYAYPAPPAYATEAIAIAPHHTYPAADFALPVGTPLFAMVDGTITVAIGNAGIYPASGGRCGNTVIIAGTDQATYTYCHLTTVAVTADDNVTAGQTIGLSGGQPGTPGAGNTTGPHLHLAITAYGRAVCPQPLLLAIIRGTPIPPTAAPTTGCYYPGPSTNWPAWLDAATRPEPPTRERTTP